jgi:hypothetical protein
MRPLSYVEEQKLNWMHAHPTIKWSFDGRSFNPSRRDWVTFLFPRTVRGVFNGELFAWIENQRTSLSDYIEIVWNE